MNWWRESTDYMLEQYFFVLKFVVYLLALLYLKICSYGHMLDIIIWKVVTYK